MEEKTVMEALSCFDRETRVSGAISICSLSNKQKHKLCDRVVEPLVMMLRNDDDESIEAALFALLSLVSGSERNKIQIANSRVLPVVLTLIRGKNKILLDLSVAFLLILSSCSANKLKIAAYGTIPLLVRILTANNTKTITEQAKIDIISTLHNLSTCHRIIPSIVLSNVTTTLIQLTYEADKSSELAEKATGLLERIVSLSDIALKEAASSDEAIQAFVEAIEEGSNLCKEYAVGILVLICRSCRERNRGRILSEGVIPGLLQLSVDGTYRAKEMARTLLLLLRDCSNRKRQWKNVLLEKAMEKIDANEKVGVALRIVEETIAKLNA